MAVPSPPPPQAKYRGLGIVLVTLSLPCLVAGVIFQFAYPTHSCVSYDFFGNCTQHSTTYPWAGAGDVLLFFFVLLLFMGLIFSFWKTTPVQYVDRPVAQYVDRPVLRYIPVQPPPPPPGFPASGQVVVNIPPQPAPKVMMPCRNCGNLNDITSGRCPRCGAPFT
jgi:hypothetical protein